MGWFSGKNSRDIAPHDFDELKKIVRNEGLGGSSVKIRKWANDGSALCQIYLSQLGLQIPVQDRTDEINIDILKFTKLAAESGDVDSQFNLAKLYFDSIDFSTGMISQEDLERIRIAKHWHRKAAETGFQPSVSLLETLECFPG